MKGGLLIAIYALSMVRAELGSLDGVSLLITADEELGSPGSRQIIEDEAREAKAALVFESGASDGAVKIARKGWRSTNSKSPVWHRMPESNRKRASTPPSRWPTRSSR